MTISRSAKVLVILLVFIMPTVMLSSYSDELDEHTVSQHHTTYRLDEHMVSNNAQQTYDTDIYNALLRRVLKQLNTIEFTLEELSLSVASTIKLEDKKALTDHIALLRTFIDNVRKQQIFVFNEKNLELLVEINKTLIAHVNETLQKELKNITSFKQLTLADGTLLANTDALVTRSQNLSAPHYYTLMRTIHENDTALTKATRGHQVAGTNAANRFFRTIDYNAQKYGVTRLLKRLIPYGVILTYFTYINDAEDLPRVLKPLKKIIGGMATPPEGNARPVASSVFDRRKYTAQHGLLGTPAHFLRQVVDVKLEPIYTLALGGILGPIIKKDVQDVYQWSVEKSKQVIAKLKGESYEDPSPIKASKLTFKDVIGYDHAKEQLSSVIRYFGAKDEFDRKGAHVDRGYLMVGPLDIGKSIAHALAGEVTTELKKHTQDTDIKCGIYEIHASKLVDKDLSDIVKEIEALSPLDPVVLLIDDLNWLVNYTNNDPNIWGNVVSTMSSALRGFRKQVIIIATADTSSDIDKRIKNQGRLGTVIYFDAPTAQERKAYLTKELTKRSVLLNHLDLDRLTLLTEQCSYDVLSTVIKNAFALAHNQKETLTQAHMEASIDTTVHGIMAHNQILTPENADVLSTHYAGKALAHMVLKPKETLIKATILPVSTKQREVIGALITHMPNRETIARTAQDLEKAAIIELAGIEAQHLLNPALVSQHLVENADKKVLALAKKSVYAGIPDQKAFPKAIQEEKRQAVYTYITKARQKARELVDSYEAVLVSLKHELQTKHTVTAQEIIQLLS